MDIVNKIVLLYTLENSLRNLDGEDERRKSVNEKKTIYKAF